MEVKDAIKGAELEQFLVGDIRRRAMPGSSSPATAVAPSHSTTGIRLQEWLRAAQDSAACVGRMPPVSSTPRSRIGAVLVRMVRRMLFWYTPQIVAFNTAAVGALREQSKAIAQLTGDLERLEKRLTAIEAAAAAPDMDRLVEQAKRALESGGIAILETTNPEVLCALLEASGLRDLTIERHGPGLYALTARKSSCGY